MALSDAADREKIVSLLDTNLVVEAAAGTGKTTAMVGRILNLMKRGHHQFAAVTFTHKAAAELRQRLEQRLSRLIADGGAAPEERANLAAAAASLADCHIGTIHSFCARLLRERPVEAGIAPDFRELDDSADRLLRAQAWSDFARRLSRGEHRDLHAVFETFGLDLDTLGQGFLVFADYPDIDEWPGRDAGLHQIDAARFVGAAEVFHRSLAPLADALENADAGTDALMPICQILLRRFPRLAMPLALADAHRLAGLFKSDPKTVRKYWAGVSAGGGGGVDKDALAELAAAYRRFHDESVLPFKNACLAAAYAAALEAYHLARDMYDALRLERGAVNFQDLLLTTARMLRDYPEVRADLAEQYPRLLVDEVQDTDPVQAEIMFLLAGENPRERDWRRCAPRPGALFIVGDPKQSIYRFRRADIITYQEIKRLVRAGGGEVLGLVSNFRSQPGILEWVNNVFCPPDSGAGGGAAQGCFAEEETPHSPAYVPLRPGLPDAEDDGASDTLFHGVFRLETLAASKKDGIGDRDIFADEAARIARFIRHAVDTRLPLPRRDGARAAQPGDFLIITYEKSKAALYADAVRALGLECRVSSGGTLGASAPLRLLADYLAAIDCPDDPVALTAVLRGRLFGVSDPALYLWKKAGNAFSYLFQRGDGPGSGGDGIAAIFGRMRAHAALLRRNSPAASLANLAGDLGLWALAATGDDPSTQAGAFAAALELLKKERPATLGALRGRLRWLRDNYDKDPLPAVESGGNAVRVMNLHKTKGLEAPVVFLACTRGLKKHDPSLAVRRGGKTVRAALALRGGQYGAVLLARPLEWDALAREEALFLDAEKTRLNYVAATRAGAALIVSVHQSGNAWKTAFLPQYEHKKTIPELLPEPDAAAVATAAALAETARPDLNRLDGTLRRSAESADALRVESYILERAKQEAGDVPGNVSGDVSTGASVAFSPEQAAAYGEVLHRALSGGPERSDESGGSKGSVAELLRSFELPGELLSAVEDTVRNVRASELWRRAEQSAEMYQEVPFTLCAESGSGAGAAPKYLRGVIDLVFRNETGWTIVDFKSDAVAKSALPAAAARHKQQLRAYARAWETLTRESVTETALYFLRPDVYCPVNIEAQAALF